MFAPPEYPDEPELVPTVLRLPLPRMSRRVIATVARFGSRLRFCRSGQRSVRVIYLKPPDAVGAESSDLDTLGHHLPQGTGLVRILELDEPSENSDIAELYRVHGLDLHFAIESQKAF